jgi:hypothetical protein
MTLRQYLAIMGLGTAVAWSAVGLIVTHVDPDEAQVAVFAILYLALFLALTGTLSIVGFLLRVSLLKKDLFISQQVLAAFRQAVLLSLLLVSMLVLKSRAMLTWWIALLAVAALTLLEFFFISARVKRGA